MTINRHNYEEYFILYMDNELSAEERRAVEAFAEKNPDLKDELDLLLHYKLEPDTSVVFTGKESLLKGEQASAITTLNYEEWLALYMDNELPAPQKAEMERFIQSHPELQPAITRLLQTKLQPEEIVFTHKESLYRSEEKVRPIGTRWWRAAAAILILAGGITTALIMSKKSSGGKDPEIARGTGPANQVSPLKQQPANTPVNNQENSMVIADQDNKQQQPGNNAVNSTSTQPVKQVLPDNKSLNSDVLVKRDNNRQADKEKVPVNTTTSKQEEALANNNKDLKRPSNNLPTPLNNDIRDPRNNNAIVSNSGNNITPNKNPLTQEGVTKANTPSSDYIHTGTNTTTDPDIEDVASGNKKGGKLRGFFRKVTRTFEKRTNIDPTENDEKLLVGGLAIKLK